MAEREGTLEVAPAERAPSQYRGGRRGYRPKKLIAAVIAVASGVALSAIAADIAIHQFRLRASEQGSAISNFVRERWGNQRATELEQLVFAYDDAFLRTWYWAQDAVAPEGPPLRRLSTVAEYGPGADDAIETATAAGEGRAPIALPEIAQLFEDSQPDEGYWTWEAPPNPSHPGPLMAQTWLHPRKRLRRSAVHVLLFDRRRTALHLVGGTKSPGADRGVVGPGVIPAEDVPRLVAAWNGGFQGTHAPDYGMFADGREYRELSDGLASLVIDRDGTVRIGQWGREFTERTDEMVAIRQNSMLIVDNGAIGATINESVAFGLVNIGDTEHFITWRSAIGLTEHGDLLVATGDHVNQEHMARAMRAAGARYAMLMDNNLPYVQTVLATRAPDGTVTLANTRDFMSASPSRYLAGDYAYDFMYLTLER